MGNQRPTNSLKVTSGSRNRWHKQPSAVDEIGLDQLLFDKAPSFEAKEARPPVFE